MRKDLTVVSEEAKYSSGVDKLRHNRRGSFEERRYSHLTDESGFGQNKTCTNIKQLSISVSNDEQSSISCHSPNNSQILHLTPSNFQSRFSHDMSQFSKQTDHCDVQSCTSKCSKHKSRPHSRNPS